eukprot:TRINITY_DN2115_c2_g2_i2.p1 TRINITY_DN2115_c2_g2~~TRINITY_DN2115_c2_g2_i2.p1  ORF type:complete len:106 (-),score=3.85 TRINITY_DN2115_c2_g2_i2:1-318(-)
MLTDSVSSGNLIHTLFHHYLIVDSDLANAVSWVKSLRGSWKMQFFFNEISHLIFDLQVTFQRISRSANGMQDCLAKQGVDRSCNLIAFILSFVAVSFPLVPVHHE